MDWTRFTAVTPSDVISTRWRTDLYNRAAPIVDGWDSRYRSTTGNYYDQFNDGSGWRAMGTGCSDDYYPATEAMGIAIAIKTGVIDPNRNNAVYNVAHLAASLAYAHRANHLTDPLASHWGFVYGTWGYYCGASANYWNNPDRSLEDMTDSPQNAPGSSSPVNPNWATAYGASRPAIAAWLLWDYLSAPDQAYVQAMVEYEANHFLDSETTDPNGVTRRDTYWHLPWSPTGSSIRPNTAYRRNRANQILCNNPPTCTTSYYDSTGDTNAEVNAWNSRLLSVATAMMPYHPNARRWWERDMELTITAFSRNSDVGDATTILQGRPVTDWLNGSNNEPFGIVVNRGIIHPRYTTAATHQVLGAALYSLAGRSTPQSILFGANWAYDGLVNRVFTYGQPCPADQPPDVGPQSPSSCYDSPGGRVYRDATGSPIIYYPDGLAGVGHATDVYALMDAQADFYGYSPNNYPEYWGDIHTGQFYQPPTDNNSLEKSAEGYLVRWLRNQTYLVDAGGTLQTSTLPHTWEDSDVGASNRLGTSSFTNGTPTLFTVRGGGAYPGETEERLHFAYQEMVGDGKIVATRTSWSPTTSISQAGIMIREDLSPNARYARVLFQNNVGSGNSPYFKWRVNPGETSQYVGAEGTIITNNISLVRQGNTFIGYRNGVEIGRATIPMTKRVYVGLFASSLDSNRSLTSITFQSVQIGTIGLSIALDCTGITDVCDGNPSTWWGSNQDRATLTLPLSGGAATVNSLGISWHLGNHRAYRFEIEALVNGAWTNVFKGDSSGTTESTEVYFFTPVTTSQLRIIGRGFGDDFSLGPWTSIADVSVYPSNP